MTLDSILTALLPPTPADGCAHCGGLRRADALVPGADPYIAELVQRHARQLAAEQSPGRGAAREAGCGARRPPLGGSEPRGWPDRSVRLRGVTVCVTP